jgi:hypothetical protein
LHLAEVKIGIGVFYVANAMIIIFLASGQENYCGAHLGSLSAAGGSKEGPSVSARWVCERSVPIG